MLLLANSMTPIIMFTIYDKLEQMLNSVTTAPHQQDSQ